MRPITTTLLGSVLVSAALWAGAAEASAKQHRYVGEHPLGAGVFCHIHAPHVHTVAPVKVDVLYRPHDGWHHFVGDPTPYGFEGETTAYAGPHPVHVDVFLGETEVDGDEIEYCYLRGPHYHLAPPPAEAKFVVRGDVHWYVGAYPPEFEVERARLARINVVYASLEYRRPVIEAPPPGWVDVYVGVDVPIPGVVVAAHAPEIVVAPPPPPPRVEGHFGLHVDVPLPVLEVRVGGPSVVVHEHHDHGHHHGHGKVKVKHRGKGHWKGHGHAGGAVKVKVKAKGGGRF